MLERSMKEKSLDALAVVEFMPIFVTESDDVPYAKQPRQDVQVELAIQSRFQRWVLDDVG